MPNKSKNTASGVVPKKPITKSYLFWTNLVVVIPFIALVSQLGSTDDMGIAILTLTIAPVALVSIGLDIYYIYKWLTKK